MVRSLNNHVETETETKNPIQIDKRIQLEWFLASSIYTHNANEKLNEWMWLAETQKSIFPPHCPFSFAFQIVNSLSRSPALPPPLSLYALFVSYLI